MLTNGDTITVGDVVYTWDDMQKAWITPAPPIPAEDVIYQQELITPAIRPIGTPPMQTFTRSYDYLKPSQGSPSAGEIMQQTNVQNMLRIHIFGQGGENNGALLAALLPDDEIVLDTTVWTITRVEARPTFYDVTVTPAQQSPLAPGVWDFTFRRPDAST